MIYFGIAGEIMAFESWKQSKGYLGNILLIFFVLFWWFFFEIGLLCVDLTILDQVGLSDAPASPLSATPPPGYILLILKGTKWIYAWRNRLIGLPILYQHMEL